MDVEFLNKIGRPLTRLALMITLALVGFAIAYQVWMWAIFNRDVTAIPLEGVLIAALPFLNQIVDNFIRSADKKAGLA